MAAYLEQGVERPGQQHDDHDGGDLHDPESLFAGFLDALEVLPPEVKRDGDGEDDGGAVDADLRRAIEQVVNRGGDPAVGVGDAEGIVDEAGNVLSGGNAGDGAGEDVIEH